jgi:hypothetical protein
MGLRNNPTCRKCGTEEETSVHVLCECEALASFRHTYVGSFFLDPEDVRKLNIGAISKPSSSNLRSEVRNAGDLTLKEISFS